MARKIKKGDYSTAQHQRICLLESKLQDLLRLRDTDDANLQALFVVNAQSALQDGELYHSDYPAWLSKTGY